MKKKLDQNLRLISIASANNFLSIWFVSSIGDKVVLVGIIIIIIIVALGNFISKSAISFFSIFVRQPFLVLNFFLGAKLKKNYLIFRSDCV